MNDLEIEVESLESRGIVPSVTAVCGTCGRLSIILYDGALEPYVHALALYAQVGKYLAQP